jgi:hypothetical protein
MRINQLNDAQQLWNLKVAQGISDPVRMSMDVKLAQDLCMQYCNGLSKMTRQFPASEHTQRIAGLIVDLSHELVSMFGNSILEQHSDADAVHEYSDTLKNNLSNPDWHDGRLTHLLRTTENQVAEKYRTDPQRLHAAFIQTHNKSPYQFYRDQQRG